MDAGPPELTRFTALAAAFADVADPDRAAPMAKYMKGHFAFFGIPSPARRTIQREVLGRWTPSEPELVAFTDAAWDRPERELQCAACDLVRRGAKRASAAFVDNLERWITHRSWWDTVDALANAVGAVVRAHPQVVDRMDAWIDADDSEFFIPKAIGWALREYAKTDPDAVAHFVHEHEAELSPLSRRKALRRVAR